MLRGIHFTCINISNFVFFNHFMKGVSIMRVKKLFKYILAISISFIILSNPFFVLQNKADALSVNLESEITGSAFLSDEIADKFVKLFYSQSTSVQGSVKNILTGKSKGSLDEIKDIYKNAVSFFKLLDSDTVEAVISKGAANAINNISDLTRLVSGVISIHDNGKSFVESTNAMQKTVDGLQIFSSVLDVLGYSSYLPSGMSIVLSSTEFALSLGGYLETAYFKENATLYQYELEIAYQTGDEIPYRKAPIITIGSSITQSEADSIFAQLYIEYCVKRMNLEYVDNPSVEESTSTSQNTTQPTTDSSFPDDKIYSGKIGDCNWSLSTSTNELIIFGSGNACLDEDVYDAPWENVKNHIKTLVVKEGVTEIGSDLFCECENLSNVIFSNTVTKIDSFAFTMCNKIKQIFIPYSVKSIFGTSFHSCKGINEIYVDKNNNYYSSLNGNLYDKLQSEFIYYAIGNQSDVFVIPETVKSIDSYAFSEAENLKEVIFNQNIQSIGDYAFSCCSQLKNIVIPDKVTNIGKAAFMACDNLEYISLPQYLNTIPDEMFQYCLKLKEIIIPDNVYKIGQRAFQFNKSLTNVKIGKNVKIIDDFAFDCCESLSNVNIPDSVTSIGKAAFFDCISLQSLFIPKSVTEIYTYYYNDRWNPIGYTYSNDVSTNTGVKKIDNFTIYGYQGSAAQSYASFAHLNFVNLGTAPYKYHYNIKSDNTAEIYNASNGSGLLYIPEEIDGHKVTSISDCAFEDALGLQEISIPCTVEHIGYKAFAGCTNVKKITVDKNNNFYSSIDGNLYNKEKTELIRYALGNTSTTYAFPDTVNKIGDYAFYGADNLKTISIPDKVTYIGEYAFHYCLNLTEISLPNNLEKINCNLLSYCPKLSNINIPSNVKTIDSYAFKNCSSLTSITIPENITDIDSAVFAGCTNLNEVSLSNNLVSIGEFAFAGCKHIKSISFPNSVVSLGNYAFENCENLVHITPSENLSNIGVDVFQGTIWETSLTDGLNYLGNVAYKYKGDCPEYICLNNGTTGIAGGAFSECTMLNYLEIPDSVCYIGEKAFCGCTNLTQINLPQKISRIEADTFVGCTMLNYISIPDNVRFIGNRAFYFCTNLEYISIPDTVEEIGEEAFYYCERLTNFEIPVNIKHISNGMFSYCQNLQEISIPNGVIDIGSYVFSSCNNLEKITLPNSLRFIDYSAFSECTNLSDVYYYGNDINNIVISDYGNDSLTSAKVNYLYNQIKGDVDNDGKVTIKDATYIQMNIASIKKLNSEQLIVADIDCDGDINVLDVTAIQKYLVNIIATLD